MPIRPANSSSVFRSSVCGDTSIERIHAALLHLFPVGVIDVTGQANVEDRLVAIRLQPVESLVERRTRPRQPFASHAELRNARRQRGDARFDAFPAGAVPASPFAVSGDIFSGGRKLDLRRRGLERILHTRIGNGANPCGGEPCGGEAWRRGTLRRGTLAEGTLWCESLWSEPLRRADGSCEGAAPLERSHDAARWPGETLRGGLRARRGGAVVTGSRGGGNRWAAGWGTAGPGRTSARSRAQAKKRPGYGASSSSPVVSKSSVKRAQASFGSWLPRLCGVRKGILPSGKARKPVPRNVPKTRIFRV